MSTLALHSARPLPSLAGALIGGIAFGAALLILGSLAHLTCSLFCLHEMAGGQAMTAASLPFEICASVR